MLNVLAVTDATSVLIIDLMAPHPYGWLSLLPPLVAIVLAIATRRAVFSLLIGVYCGSLILTGGHPLAAIYDSLEVQLWPAFVEPSKLRVFAFTMLMGAMIGVICRCGGMQGLIRLISPFAKSRRGGQLVTWLLGLMIFFDDYANTILLGSTLRPVCDRLKISREKLAYLVDSTAAPVAGLSLLSTWVAVEIEYIQEGLQNLNTIANITAVDLFVGSIVYRFYMLFSLVLIPLIAITGRDFGPMLTAERRRLRETHLAPSSLSALDVVEEESTNVPARWYNAVLPIVATLAVVLCLLYTTGMNSLAIQPGDPRPALRDILGAANPSLSLQYGALTGLVLVVLMVRLQGILSQEQILKAAGQGAKVILPAIAILWCASALSRMTSNRSLDGETSSTRYGFQDQRLYTGDYLAELIIGDPEETQESEQPGSLVLTTKLLPTAVFLLAAVLSFATGSSFGTMGILAPIVVTLTYTLLSSDGSAVAASNPIMLASVGGVLAGAVFGDHCSPISDTTILSAQSSACDHIAHVVTQLPYALFVAGVTILLGTLPIGWGVSVWVLMPLQFVALVVGILAFGRRVE